ncbi:MAG: hypothetical protein ACYTFT_14875, partial [Planctomycetota bacterium]
MTASFACKGDSKTPDKATAGQPATATKATAAAAKAPAKAGTHENPIPVGNTGFSGRHRVEENDKWIPAEFKTGMAKFKDPGVYVDGKPVSFLKWGELPVPLKVWWFEERAAIPFNAKTKGPRYKLIKQRRYYWVDYFKALGVDVSKIKEMHIYGGSKRRIAVVVKGDQLRSRADFGFRFGTDVQGKPIPACPLNIADGNCPDNIRSVTVYLDKKPPTRKGGYFYTGDKRILGIPYYGEPMRGGIRVYMDGPLVAQIKRRKLKDESLKAPSTDGKTHWKFFAFLKTQGVDTDKIQEAWIINDNRRKHRLTRAELVDATFTAASQRKGRILFGAKKYETKAIA